MKTLAQERAADALQQSQHISQKSESFQKCYRAYVERLGPAVLINGLGQAMAMTLSAAGAEPKSDDEKAHQTLFQNLSQWLCRPNGGVYAGNTGFMAALTTGNQDQYILAQAEALAWLTWHKKFCRATLQKPTVEEPS